MPDFSKCVKSADGGMYCWDKTKKTFVKVTADEIPAGKVPFDVIEQFADMAGTDCLACVKEELRLWPNK